MTFLHSNLYNTRNRHFTSSTELALEPLAIKSSQSLNFTHLLQAVPQPVKENFGSAKAHRQCPQASKHAI